MMWDGYQSATRSGLKYSDSDSSDLDSTTDTLVSQNAQQDQDHAESDRSGEDIHETNTEERFPIVDKPSSKTNITAGASDSKKSITTDADGSETDVGSNDDE